MYRITDAVEITSSILKHLTLANATLTYIRARILARLSRNPDHETFEKEVISALISTYNMAERMKLVLGKTLKHFSKVCSYFNGLSVLHKCKNCYLTLHSIFLSHIN